MAPDAVRVDVLPAQTVVEDAVKVKVGKAFMFTVIVCLFLQLLLSVAFTVYVVVAVGVATTGVPLAELKLEAGLQVYVLAPAAVKVDVVPAQTVVEDAVKVKVGKGLTVTVTVSLLVQSAALVAFTV